MRTKCGVHQAHRATGPARGGTEGAVPEPRPLQIEPGPSHQRALAYRDVRELQVASAGARERFRLPARGHGSDAGRSEFDLDQHHAALAPAGDEREVHQGATAAVLLDPVQEQMPIVGGESQHSARGFGSPHAIDGTGLGSAPCLMEDRHGIQVTFDETSEREILPAELREGEVPLRGSTVPGQGQIERTSPVERPNPIHQRNPGGGRRILVTAHSHLLSRRACHRREASTLRP